MTAEKAESRKVCRCAPDCRERIDCGKVGTLGHAGCGWCEAHGQARHICLCPVVTPPASEGGEQRA